MKLTYFGHDYRYACEQMMTTLFPDEKPVYEGTQENSAVLSLFVGPQILTAVATLNYGGNPYRSTCRADRTKLTGHKQGDDRLCQRILKLAFYRAGCAALGGEPAWGALTGVRPVKLPTRDLLAGVSERQARRTLREVYRVSESRISLAMDCAKASVETVRGLKADELSLYVGIPFCPSRCAYCSFVSADVGKSLGSVEPFLDCLEQELAAAGRNLKAQGRAIRTVYIGGGTPTTLTAPQLDRLLTAMEQHLDLSRCTECTVEAGRPDTITREKMAVLASHGVDRVSVNPQTMENNVLAAMGRAHRAEDIPAAYAAVRAAGPFDVNMDLIAGLPRDTEEGFRRTVEAVLAFGPENITVHTLALKKGSALMAQGGQLPTADTVAAMLDFAWESLRRGGYVPYYLYRQKYMSGGFENVGWCRPGKENRYNIIMMEELHSVLSLGGGGITKLVHPTTGAIERMNNPKYPKEYMERICAVCEEKEKIVWPIS